MPLFLHALLAWSRRRPLLAFLGTGLVGWLIYWQVAPATPVTRPMIAKAAVVPGLGTERAVMEKTLLDMQRDNAQLRGSLQEHERTLRQMQQSLAKAEQDRQAALQAQEQRLDEVLKRAQQAQRPPPAPVPRPSPAPKPQAAALSPKAAPQVSDSVPSVDHAAKVRILRSDKAASFSGPPPALNRGDVPYLQTGSFAEGRVITGVMATARANGALPVLFSVTKEFQPPLQIQGPGYHPIPTALPIQGCFILGKAQADLASSRVIIQLEFLSCVMPDNAAFERPIRGYATGPDGTLGIVGRYESRDTVVLAKTFLTSLLAGASEAFAPAKRTTILTPLGGSVNAQTGNVGEMAGFSALAHASAQLSQFYLQQAEKLMPVLWLESGTAARLVLQEGLPLEGLPTSIMVSTGGR